MSGILCIRCGGNATHEIEVNSYDWQRQPTQEVEFGSVCSHCLNALIMQQGEIFDAIREVVR